MRKFTELFLSNIMKYGKNDIEWQTSIWGMNLGDFGDYLRKGKEALIHDYLCLFIMYFGWLADTSL